MATDARINETELACEDTREFKVGRVAMQAYADWSNSAEITKENVFRRIEEIIIETAE